MVWVYIENKRQVRESVSIDLRGGDVLSFKTEWNVQDDDYIG
jgi:hypothetical protein